MVSDFKLVSKERGKAGLLASIHYLLNLENSPKNRVSIKQLDYSLSISIA